METSELDPQIIIQVLIEELRAKDENRLYLLALLKQRELDHDTERLAWESKNMHLEPKED